MTSAPSVAALAAAAFLFAAVPAVAGDHPLAAPGAPFVFAGGDGERERVRAAIDEAVAGMSFIIRPIARRRLTAGNRVFETLTVAREGEDLVVDRDGVVVRSPADGSPADWTGSDGKAYRVSQRLTPAGLVQTFDGKDGTRENTFSLAEDGTLRVEVVVRSARLPAPLAYALTYARRGGRGGDAHP